MTKDSATVGASNVVASPTEAAAQDPEEVIDGEKNPDKIPDKVAYSLLLRFLANRKIDDEKNRARFYLRMIFGCDSCPGTSMTREERAAAHANIEKLLSIATDFEQQVVPLDKEARELRAVGFANLDPATKTELRKLQATKEQVVKQTMLDLPSRLGSEGTSQLNKFITEQFKRRVKIHLGKPKNLKATKVA